VPAGTGSVRDLPSTIAHPDVLDAVSHLYFLGVATTTEDVAEVLDRRGLGPVAVESLRDTLEELADKRELGRIRTAPHRAGERPHWTTSYFPTSASR